MVAHACNPSYLGGWSRRIALTREAEVAVGWDRATALQPGDRARLHSPRPQKTQKQNKNKPQHGWPFHSLWMACAVTFRQLGLPVAPTQHVSHHCSHCAPHFSKNKFPVVVQCFAVHSCYIPYPGMYFPCPLVRVKLLLFKNSSQTPPHPYYFSASFPSSKFLAPSFVLSVDLHWRNTETSVKICHKLSFVASCWVPSASNASARAMPLLFWGKWPLTSSKS